MMPFDRSPAGELTLAATCLHRLSLELLEHITSFLAPSEYGVLRLACRSLEQTLFPAFCRHFFSHRQFMLTEFSLQTLLDISRSRVGQALKHVDIGIERFRIEPGRVPGGPHNEEVHCKGFDDQSTFLWSGQAVQMLTEALTNLQPSVVGVQPRLSYGYNTAQEAGVRGLLSPYDLEPPHRSWPTQVVAVLLAALARSSARPKRLDLFQTLVALRPRALNIPGYLRPGLLPILVNIQEVHLRVALGNGPHGGAERHVSSTGAGPHGTHCPDLLLREFLVCLPELRSLSLGLASNFQTAFIQWLGSDSHQPSQENTPPHSANSPPPSPISEASSELIIQVNTALLQPSPPSVSFPKLEELKLEGFSFFDPEALYRIYDKFSGTLKVLRLDGVGLSHDDGTGSEGSRRNKNLWANFLKKLRGKPNSPLRQLVIAYPRQDRWAVSFQDNRILDSQDWRHSPMDLDRNVIVHEAV